MVFNTYVINLDQDKKKWKDIKTRLSKVDIKPIRFKAIYGKNVKRDNCKNLTGACKLFTPDSVTGIGLSHIYLNKHIYENDPYDFSVILEDDATPLFKDKKEIENVIKNAPKDWEFISLYCNGICHYDDPNDWMVTLNGSFVSYIVNKKGSKKISELKLINHIDMQISTENIKVYKYPKKMFMSPDDDNNLTTTNRSEIIGSKFFDSIPNVGNLGCKHSHYLGYNLFRIPGINKNLSILTCYLIISSILSIYFIQKFYKDKKIYYKCIIFVPMLIVCLVCLILFFQGGTRIYYSI